MASWDDEDYDPEANFQQPAQISDRWEGEDEDENVKASWEDADVEEKNGEGEEDDGRVRAVQRKKKKKLEDILKEKEEKRRQEIEARKKEEEERLKQLSPEGEIEERLRRQKLQEESDLQLAKEAFGVSDGDGRVTIDSMNPKTEEEFTEFGKLLKEKILQFEQSTYYVDFLDELFKACSLDLDAEHVKRLGTNLTAIAQEKIKAQKAVTKSKKKSKKAVLAGSGKGGRSGDLDAYDMGGNELDDFM